MMKLIDLGKLADGITKKFITSLGNMKEKMLIEYGLKTGAVELTKKYLIMYS